MSVFRKHDDGPVSTALEAQGLAWLAEAMADGGLLRGTRGPPAEATGRSRRLAWFGGNCPGPVKAGLPQTPPPLS